MGKSRTFDPRTRAPEQFFGAYVTHGTFVSGFARFTVAIPFGETLLSVPLHHAIVVMDISNDGLSVTNGTLAGVLLAEDLVTVAQTWAGRVSRSLCGSAFDGIAAQLRATSDITADGPNIAGRACDGISFGIGFEGKRIANPTRVAASPPQFDPCSPPDAGMSSDAADETTD